MTLVELMVSITITLIVVAALIALFLNVSSSQREMGKINQQIETGRISTFLLENEIALAGFWENYVPQFDDVTLTTAPANVPTAVPPSTGVPDPCLAYLPAAPWAQDYKRSLIDIPIQTYDTVPATCSTLLTNQKSGTDVLVVRHAESCLPGTPNCEAYSTDKLYFQSSQCGTSGAEPPSSFDLSTATDVPAPTPLHARDCVTPSVKRKFVSDIYYIRDYAETAADGIPTLMRSRFDFASGALGPQAPVPLVEGVEGFQVELGLDTLSSTGAAVNYSQAVNWADATNRTTPTNRGDGSPDGNFIHCSTASPCTADQLINVVAVKIHVLARSADQTPGYADTRSYTLGTQTLCPANSSDSACTSKTLLPQYRRHAFATSIRLNNVAGRRDTP